MRKSIESIKQEKQFRSFRIERAAVNAESRTVDLSFSSEMPVERWFGMEVLDHSKSSCDLSRLNSGGALLIDHDPSDQVGVVESAEIDTKEKKGRATVRFGKSQRASEIFQDVQDGIRSLVSVGYDVTEVKTEKGQANSPDIVRILRWQPLEISIVSIPADPSVGVGRNHDKTDEKHMRIHLDPEPSPGGGGAAPATPAPAPTVNVEEITKNVRTKETERAKVVRSLAKAHNLADFGEEHVMAGTEINEFRNALLEKIPQARALTPAERNPAIGMSDKEVRKYSLLRAISTASEKRLDGLEKEASDAVAKRIGREPSGPLGFFVPWDVSTAPTLDRGIAAQRVAYQRALNVNAGASGGFLVDTEVQAESMIELLRNSMVISRLGARSLSGLTGNIAIPRITGGATAYWLPESGQVTASDQAFGQLGLVPHKLMANTAYTKQLLVQASPDVESLVRSDIMAVLAIEKDRAAINGLGASGEPLGLLNTTGINSVTFGAAATWAKVIDFEQQVESANALMGNCAYLTTPATKAKWKGATKVTNQAVFLWESGNQVNGYNAIASKQVPSDKVIFGNWNDLIIADWDGIDVVVDPYTLAKTSQIQITITLMSDLCIRHAVSFTVSTDSGAQ
jgi:HK97 family phage major capsid protein